MSIRAKVCPQAVVENIDARRGLARWGCRGLEAVLCVIVVVGCLAGCRGFTSKSQPQVNPIPSLATGSLSPSSAAAGGPAFTLTVTGANFISASTVEWNGSARTTTFVSGTGLQAAITAADIATAATAQVSVSTPSPGGGTSSALTFTINNTNAAPTIASLNPSSAAAGGAAFTLTVTGSNFVSSSTVQWNGTARTTTFVSGTTLHAAIAAADIATGGTATVTVSTPAPGGGTSSGLAFTISNPAPTIVSLNPSSATAAAAGFMLTVTGSNFVSSSTVQWNGSARTTTFVSSTSLQAAITAADIATGATATVTVSSPAPGGGTSSGVAFTVDNPVPTATSLNPNSASAGGPGLTLTVTGTNFMSASTVLWNGAARATTFVSSTSLQAAITAADISAVGTGTVSVSNPAPSGGTSAPLTFTIKVPPPAITLLSPGSAVAGGTAFTLTVAGTNFVAASTVQWNGTARTTTFVSNTQLQAAITAADIAAIGVGKVTVANPVANGGVSAVSTFFVGATGGANFAEIAVNQATKDIVYDAVNRKLYLSVTGTAATNPNTISVLDPATATITSTTAAGSNPDVLATFRRKNKGRGGAMS